MGVAFRWSAIGFALLLAACNQTSTETGQDASADQGADDAPQPTVQQPVPENLTDDPRNEAVPLELPPSPAATTAAARPQAFPAAFQGRWGLVAADCEPGRSDAKGLMEVGPTSLRFYESRGTVRSMAQPRPARIEATLAFTGEGQDWTRANALTLINDRTLVREERDPPNSLRYARCPSR